MYLEIDGKTYFIHIKTDINSIILKKIDEDIVHLHVPARFPNENLIAYTKTELPKLISSHKSLLNNTITELALFDKIYPVKLDKTTLPYIKNDMVYANTKSFTTRSNIDKLKYSLLLNFINSCLSCLEEELNLILPEVNIKKLKTKYYAVCHTKEYITYSKTLVDHPKDFITYVVIHAVGKFLGYLEDQVYFLLNKYVSDWKHCERVYKYEQ